MEMQEIYTNLVDLQKILTERFKLEEKMEELPRMLSSRIEVLNRLKKSYLAKHEQFKKLEENIFSHQKMMGELSLHQKRLSEKVKAISTQREYEALDNEIAMAKKKEEEYRFHLLQDQRVIEDLRGALSKDEIAIKQQEEDIVKEEERIKSELDKIKKEHEALLKNEENLTKEIDENIRYKFEKIVKNKDGIGIVSVTKGYCNGCYLAIPAEFINKIRENKEIQFCPNCSRILFYDDNPESLFAIDQMEEEDINDFFGDDDNDE
jgi:predicted  nucleic acid-binding Zn-ribbon protein